MRERNLADVIAALEKCGASRQPQNPNFPRFIIMGRFPRFCYVTNNPRVPIVAQREYLRKLEIEEADYLAALA